MPQTCPQGASTPGRKSSKADKQMQHLGSDSGFCEIPRWRKLGKSWVFHGRDGIWVGLKKQAGVRKEKAFWILQMVYWATDGTRTHWVQVWTAGQESMKYVGIQPLDIQRLSLALEKSFSQIWKFWFKYVQISHVGERKGEGWLGRVFCIVTKARKKWTPTLELLWRSWDLSPDPTRNQKGESIIPIHEIRNTLNILVEDLKALWRTGWTSCLTVTSGL